MICVVKNDSSYNWVL